MAIDLGVLWGVTWTWHNLTHNFELSHPPACLVHLVRLLQPCRRKELEELKLDFQSTLGILEPCHATSFGRAALGPNGTLVMFPGKGCLQAPGNGWHLGLLMSEDQRMMDAWWGSSVHLGLGVSFGHPRMIWCKLIFHMTAMVTCGPRGHFWSRYPYYYHIMRLQ